MRSAKHNKWLPTGLPLRAGQELSLGAAGDKRVPGRSGGDPCPLTSPQARWAAMDAAREPPLARPAHAEARPAPPPARRAGAAAVPLYKGRACPGSRCHREDVAIRAIRWGRRRPSGVSQSRWGFRCGRGEGEGKGGGSGSVRAAPAMGEGDCSLRLALRGTVAKGPGTRRGRPPRPRGLSGAGAARRERS